ncbi:MAG: leucine--tRNA ligase [Candidatus Woesearchaeota archaeon]
MAELNFTSIEEKWQQKWADAKLFEPEVDQNKQKFFLTFPYPYINGIPHLGHLYTIMRVEAFARYKRLKGYNVLFPQGWHATGSPIVLAAKRVAEKEPKQLSILKDIGVTDEELPKFEDPEYWVSYFAPIAKHDYARMGLSIDWRREFFTTTLNPIYDAFVRWQFNTLKKKGYVIKGRFPVVWDPKSNIAVGDHDRSEGEGETTQEFCLFKFKLPDGRFIITATLRPDTVMGITNVYVNPEETYVEVTLNNETWIVGKPIVEKLVYQDFNPVVGQDVFGKDLVGKYVESFSGQSIPVLPASFLKTEYGTGMVHSVPSDSADDLIALRNIQKDEETLKHFGLDVATIQAIEPIPVFDTPGYGNIPAQKFLDDYKVNSQNERDKLEKIKKDLYKLTFNQATFNETYASGFSENLQGVLVKDGQELIKRDLLSKGAIAIFYELTGKVVSRSLTPCVVKIVSDQWFIDYANPEWKKNAHKCLEGLKLYPEKARQQFSYVIDWLHEWACTRETGLGTKLPWDEKWLIESLSDSTAYKAFYTIAHKLKDIPAEYITDSLFDYVFLEDDSVKPQVSQEVLDDLRKEFSYWFPCDFRNSGKDLIQNHLTFYLFTNVALFPEKYWPKGIGVNGWVTVDGEKMSKSLGNMIPLRDMPDKFGVDASRLTILSGGEGLDDPNWESDFAKVANTKYEQIFDFATTWYDKGVDCDDRNIDAWFASEYNALLATITAAMDETQFRTAIQKVFFDIPRIVKWYLKRTQNNPQKQLLNTVIEAQLIMLSPFAPHVCEEAWEAIGKTDFVAKASWPLCDESKIDETALAKEQLVESVVSDIRTVMGLAKVEHPESVTLISYPSWKYDFYTMVSDLMKETRNIKDMIPKIMSTDLKQYGGDIMKLLPKIVSQNALPEVLLSVEDELSALSDAKDFIAKELGFSVVVQKADDVLDNPKAKQASPGKPAIIVA